MFQFGRGSYAVMQCSHFLQIHTLSTTQHFSCRLLSFYLISQHDFHLQSSGSFKTLNKQNGSSWRVMTSSAVIPYILFLFRVCLMMDSRTLTLTRAKKTYRSLDITLGLLVTLHYLRLYNYFWLNKGYNCDHVSPFSLQKLFYLF